MVRLLDPGYLLGPARAGHSGTSDVPLLLSRTALPDLAPPRQQCCQRSWAWGAGREDGVPHQETLGKLPPSPVRRALGTRCGRSFRLCELAASWTP